MIPYDERLLRMFDKWMERFTRAEQEEICRIAYNRHKLRKTTPETRKKAAAHYRDIYAARKAVRERSHRYYMKHTKPKRALKRIQEFEEERKRKDNGE